MRALLKKWLSTERSDVLVALALSILTLVALQVMPRLNGLGPAAPGAEPTVLNLLFAVMVYGAVPFAIATIPAYLFIVKVRRDPPGGPGPEKIQYHWRHEDGIHAPIILDPRGDFPEDYYESFLRGQRKERATLIAAGFQVL